MNSPSISTGPNSMPPPGMTGPMVWYALIRELPYLVGILTGGVVAGIFLWKSPNSNIEAIVTATAPILVSALARSRPAESETLQKLAGVGGVLAALSAWWGGPHAL